MKTRQVLLVWLAAFALALPASAQDEAPEPPAGQAPPPAGETAGEPEDGGEAADEDEGEEVEEREFIFSEEIPADQQVTFPVDI